MKEGKFRGRMRDEREIEIVAMGRRIGFSY